MKMTFFSNPNRGAYPPPYGQSEQYGRPNPFRRQRNFNASPNPYQQQDYFPPVYPNSRWQQEFNSPVNPYASQQQPFSNPYDRQQQPLIDPYDRQQQPFFNPYDRQQPSGRPSLMDGLNTLMGHAGTVTNGVNTMRQIGSLLGFLR